MEANRLTPLSKYQKEKHTSCVKNDMKTDFSNDFFLKIVIQYNLEKPEEMVE